MWYAQRCCARGSVGKSCACTCATHARQCVQACARTCVRARARQADLFRSEASERERQLVEHDGPQNEIDEARGVEAWEVKWGGCVPLPAGANSMLYKPPYGSVWGISQSREPSRGLRGVITAGESTCYVLLVARSLLSNKLAFHSTTRPYRTHG